MIVSTVNQSANQSATQAANQTRTPEDRRERRECAALRVLVCDDE